MKKDLEKLPKYTFDNYADEDNTYFFVTKSQIEYLIKFRQTNYLFSTDSPLNSLTFEFIIEVFSNPTGKNPPLDSLTSATVAAIFQDFYQRNNHSISVYICDSSDSRQAIRQRKFDLWFNMFNLSNGFVKFDLAIKDKEGIIYPISIMFRTDNPHRLEIIEQFDKVISGYSK
ncbi:MAG: DUF6169 family protein [Spirosomaceae bacterium]|jgi:hypothetical protein|nr:DUF6169 family protein [Spirosomataceae bacterium]